MADLFSLDDLAAALHLDEVDETRGYLLLRRVTARIASEITTIPDPVPEAVWEVALSMAVRAYSNPSGMQSETIGDYTYNRGRGAEGGVTMTAGERSLLRQSSGLSVSMSSVPLTALSIESALAGLE